ncbi:unnamed protein product [Rotaria sordida]|uniref:F5/8 type C domain-containing protein n=1 Tax=Rotaria sordida TaxID=392033 RepID=A0A819M9R3_9BILA|nr:unnamed protein product [Rotaria sordida]
MASNIEIELNETQLRVSSVLNKDNKNYGKKNLIDGNEETCWNSEAGSPQWIQITPMKCISLNSIAIKFQGGFAAKRFVIEDRQQDGTFTSIAEFYPDNHGKLQISFFLNSLTLDKRLSSSNSACYRSNSISINIL